MDYHKVHRGWHHWRAWGGKPGDWRLEVCQWISRENAVFQCFNMATPFPERREGDSSGANGGQALPGGVLTVPFKSRPPHYPSQSIPLEYILNVPGDGYIPASQADWPSLLCR
jgi:hypothetical protein